MKCLALVVLGLAALVAARPEAPKPAGSPTDDVQAQLQEVFGKAQQTLNEFSANVQKQISTLDQQAVLDQVKNNTDALAKNLQVYIDALGKDIKEKTPEVQKTWDEAKARLAKVVEDFNKSVPQAQESAAQLQEKFAEGIKTVVQESGKIAETFKENSGELKEKVAQITKQLVDNAVKATDNLNKQLQAAVAEKKA